MHNCNNLWHTLPRAVGEAVRNDATHVCEATQSMAQRRAGDVDRGDVGCRMDRLRKMWVRT